jgi:hypothetical protein
MLLKCILWAVFVEQLYGEDVDGTFGGMFSTNWRNESATVALAPPASQNWASPIQTKPNPAPFNGSYLVLETLQCLASVRHFFFLF